MKIYTSREDTFYKRIISSQAALFLPGLILAAIGTSFAVYRLLSPDVSYFLEVSARLLDGKKLYQDFIDNQFPTIHLISLLIVLLSRALSLSIPNSFFITSFMLLNASVFLTWRILKNNVLFQEKMRQALLLTFLYYLLFISPHDFTDFNWQNFGQREHFFIALVLPYIAVVLNRLQSSTKQVTQPLIITSGLLAGIGFSMKPHFLLIFVASELAILWHTKTVWTWARQENIQILSVLLLCFLGMIFITPNYFKTVPCFVDLYQATARPWQTLFLISLSLSLIPLLLLLWVLIEKKLRIIWTFTPYFFALSVASIILIPLGLHGLVYHRLPFQLITLLWIGLIVCAYPKKFPHFIFFLALFIWSMLRWQQQLPLIRESRDFNFQLASKIQQYVPEGRVVVPLTIVNWAYPSITYAKMRRSGLPYLWYIPFTYSEHKEEEAAQPYHHSNQMGKTERFFHEHVIHSLETDPPQLIVLNKTDPKIWTINNKFELINYLSQYPRFVKLWKKYHYVSRLSDPIFGSQLELYRRE